MYELVNLNTREELMNYKLCIKHEVQAIINSTRNDLSRFDSDTICNLDETNKNKIITYCQKRLDDTDKQIDYRNRLLIEIDKRIEVV